VRGKFGNIGDIQENLVNRAVDLVRRAVTYSRGRATKKVVGFYQACIAFCFITIPTITTIDIRVRLYI
jgi:hypothetical protein